MHTHGIGLTFISALLVAGCAREPATTKVSDSAAGEVAVFSTAELAAFAPIDTQMAGSAGAPEEPIVTLGRALYNETLLSDSHDISCNSCHPLNGWGADGRKVSLGHDGHPGMRNSPSVYHAFGQVAQFWDGRAKDVEAQAKGPILNPVEMGMTDSARVLEHLRESTAYVARFKAAFPGERIPITYDNVGRSIGAYERKLATPSRWDHFLSGDSTALSADERRGLRTFLSTGCQTCHTGKYVGGDRYMKAGMVNPWFSQADSGRFLVTHDAADLFVFKVPSLRNVDKDGPLLPRWFGRLTQRGRAPHGLPSAREDARYGAGAIDRDLVGITHRRYPHPVHLLSAAARTADEVALVATHHARVSVRVSH